MPTSQSPSNLTPHALRQTLMVRPSPCPCHDPCPAYQVEACQEAFQACLAAAAKTPLNTGFTPEGETETAVICCRPLAWLQSMAFLWCQVFLNLEAFAKNLGWPSNSLHKVEIKRSRDEITVRQVPCQVPRSPLIRYLVEFWGSYSFWKFKDPATNIARENR